MKTSALESSVVPGKLMETSGTHKDRARHPLVPPLHSRPSPPRPITLCSPAGPWPHGGWGWGPKPVTSTRPLPIGHARERSPQRPMSGGHGAASLSGPPPRAGAPPARSRGRDVGAAELWRRRCGLNATSRHGSPGAR